jgi:SAM-dependent methyltransferase
VTGIGSDAGALGKRIDAHRRFSSRDVDAWILGWLLPRPGERILDLGCGTGKQSLPLARSVGAGGQVVGLDVSPQALAQAGETARAEGLVQLRLLEGRLEELDAALGSEPAFDAAACCFALYYSAAPLQTLRDMRSRLAPGGRAFVCGPARENNRAFVELCEAVAPPDAQPWRLETSLTFMDVEGPRLFEEVFDSVELSRFENPMTFPGPEDLMAYWRSYHLYSPGREPEFRRALDAHFREHGRFTTVKVVRGALLR